MTNKDDESLLFFNFSYLILITLYMPYICPIYGLYMAYILVN